MIDVALISSVISAAASGVALFDKIADQVERFISKKPEPAIPKEFRMKIEKEGDAIVSRYNGIEQKRITLGDLENLPEATLRHVKVYEEAMQNHYNIWSSVYPQLALMDSPLQKARVEAQLKSEIKNMQVNLNGILSFLESNGMYLDDHYIHVRDLVNKI
jgi:hypothetical protein